MEIGGTQNSRDDRMSCRSFGSNYHPCSQSRKISIGVMIDSLAKSGPKTSKDVEAGVPAAEKSSRKLNTGGDISGREQIKAATAVNQIDQEQNTSPWLKVRSLHQRKSTSEDVHQPKATTNSPADGNAFGRSNGTNPTSAANDVEAPVNNENVKKFNKVYGRDGGKGGDREGANGLPSATGQGVPVPEKEAVKDKAEGTEDKRQVLRMKLWDILETVTSPVKQASQASDLGVNNLNPEENVIQKCDTSFKHKQNSDTIESDSQSPVRSMKRAVTRSLARKKAASKAPASRSKKAQQTASAKKSLQKNIFTFDAGNIGKGYDADAGGSSKSSGKNKGRKSSKVEARRISFSKSLNADEVHPAIETSKTSKGTEKTSSFGNRTKNNQNSPPKNHDRFVVADNRNQENGFSLLSASKSGVKGSTIEPHRRSFPENILSDEDQPEKGINKTMENAKKTSSNGIRMRSYRSCSFQDRREFSNMENGNQEIGTSLAASTKSGSKNYKQGSSLVEDVHAEAAQPTVNTSKATRSAKPIAADGNKKISCQSSPPENNTKFVSAENGSKENDSPPLSAKKFGNVNMPKFSHHWFQQEGFGSSPLKNTMDPQEDLQSPTFEIKTKHGVLNDQSPGNYRFNSSLASKPDNYTPDAGTRTPNDTEEAEDSPPTESEPMMAAKDAEDKLSSPSSENMDSENSQEDWATKALSPDVGTSGNAEFTLYPSKRLRRQENIKFPRFSPIIASPEVMEESDRSQEPPRQDKEDGLTNAISILALALRRVKSKIESVTTKKSTEVLKSVAEGVQLLLQNAESQLERDVGKIASLNKSKRKHLETEFEEQQEQLKLICQKFKEDLHQHIQVQSSNVEGLQAQEKEFRVFMEKRKASQRELLKQIEESIQTQLSDAETRISAVHELGREKMNQLKHALAKCLKEGMLD